MEIGGKPLRMQRKSTYTYVMLNKPRGYLSSVSDDRGRKCVTELVSDIKLRLYPVGRLDMDSDGLLLMTNDGDLAYRLTHPKHHVYKTYRAHVQGVLSRERIAKLRNENNITQFELAEKLGVTDRAVSKWETGGGFPDITLLPQIADIFNVNVDYLLRGKPIIKQKFYLGCGGHCNDDVNKNYLENGWKIVDMKLSGEGGDCSFAIVMEKEIFED